ncbi:glycosyltransferase family 2 protein [Raoultella ornithinolytica]|uniref:glycosyltransferase family 2 protein n=1 Tax=Raoultella TaxID=160674 RepID=UPI0039B41480
MINNNNFKIHALMTIKNEADIVIETLNSASKWADNIFILDNMSNDKTWELISEYAKTNEKVKLWGRYGGKFYLALRQVIFKDFKKIAKPGDWWCRLDGDEFYIDDPREFLSELEESVDHVYNASFQYYYTNDDYLNEISIEVESSVTERLRWYKCNHSEIRFVRHFDNICWPQNTEWPCNIINPSEKRIRLKHYQYRDVKQIIARLSARNAPDSGDSFTHEKVPVKEWYLKRNFAIPEDERLAELRIVDKKDLLNDENYIYSDLELPPIIKNTYKRKLKNAVVRFYMKYLNNFFFKI